MALTPSNLVILSFFANYTHKSMWYILGGWDWGSETWRLRYVWVTVSNHNLRSVCYLMIQSPTKTFLEWLLMCRTIQSHYTHKKHFRELIPWVVSCPARYALHNLIIPELIISINWLAITQNAPDPPLFLGGVHDCPILKEEAEETTLEDRRVCSSLRRCTPVSRIPMALLLLHIRISGQNLGARLRGRTATSRSKKGSEKVLGRVLGKGFSEGFWEGGLLWGLQ